MSWDTTTLAALNAVVAVLCLLDFMAEPSTKLLFATLSWLGSTLYWAVRGGFET